jgi:hypothetical protein
VSLHGTDGFGIGHVTDAEVRNGTSILLTGTDTDALETVFYRLLAPADDERSIVLATERDGRSVKRAVDRVERGLGDRTTVLTCEGPDRGDGVTTIDDVSDLTKTGMEFSTLVANAQQEADRFRAGIYLCSSVCARVDDTRSVYRFLNSNFLTELRRGDGIGVCALDTAADVGANVGSIVAGLETSFGARIDVAESTRSAITLDVEGLGDADGPVDVER